MVTWYRQRVVLKLMSEKELMVMRLNKIPRRLVTVYLTPNLLGQEILCGLNEGGLVELVAPVLNISTA